VRGGETYEVTRDKDSSGAVVWKINQPPALAGRTADTAKVDQVVATLRGLQATRLVAEKPAPDVLKKYGLEPPAIRAVVTVPGDDKKPKEWVYLIGGESEDKAGRYAKLGDRDLVFLTPADVAKTLQTDLASPKVFAFDPAKVKEITLVGWKKVAGFTVTLDLARKPGDLAGWVVKNNLSDFNLDAKKVDELVNELSKLNAEQFVSFKAGPKPEYELGPAERTLQIEITVEGEKAPLTLALGKLDAGKKGYYAESSVLKGDVFLVAQDRFEKVVTGGLKYFSR